MNLARSRWFIAIFSNTSSQPKVSILFIFNLTELSMKYNGEVLQFIHFFSFFLKKKSELLKKAISKTVHTCMKYFVNLTNRNT